jgi:hypothetical protein
MENPGKPNMPMPEERNGLQNALTIENPAFAAQGRRHLGELEMSAAIADEQRNCLTCGDEAHAAPECPDEN